MKGSLIILSFFITGIIAGITFSMPESMAGVDLSVYALYILMFLVGVSVGGDQRSWSMLHGQNLRFILLPAGTILGTWAGVSLINLLLSDIQLRDSLAIGSGFGYYSLSSIFIAELRGQELGVIALISNIIRELITLIFTPLFVRYFGNLSAIASAGATSMDTTLPVITLYSGKEYAITSVFHGTVLTILVPVIVVTILSI